MRSTGEPGVSRARSKIKIELLSGNRELAIKIAREIEARFHVDCSIILWIYQVEALRDHKF